MAFLLGERQELESWKTRRRVMKRTGIVKQRGRKSALRLKAERTGVPVMVGVKIRGTRKTIVFAFLVWASLVWGSLAWAATYYVSSSAGNDGNAGNKPGSEKKDAAMSFLQNAIAMTDAVASREIIEPDKFRDGISKIIDGTVQCLNASTWCKHAPAASTQPSA
jgi:hypothetical protein